MMPAFIARRVRWVWFAGLATAVWMNRRDAARWLRFGARSIARRDQLDLQTWLTEARVRAAITTDPVLRCDPDLDDVEIANGKVTVRTGGVANWNAGTHLDALRRVKGVAHVACMPSDSATSDRNDATAPVSSMDQMPVD